MVRHTDPCLNARTGWFVRCQRILSNFSEQRKERFGVCLPRDCANRGTVASFDAMRPNPVWKKSQEEFVPALFCFQLLCHAL